MTVDHPEDWSPKFDQKALEIALDAVDDEAALHNAEYAAGVVFRR